MRTGRYQGATGNGLQYLVELKTRITGVIKEFNPTTVSEVHSPTRGRRNDGCYGGSDVLEDDLTKLGDTCM